MKGFFTKVVLALQILVLVGVGVFYYIKNYPKPAPAADTTKKVVVPFDPDAGTTVVKSVAELSRLSPTDRSTNIKVKATGILVKGSQVDRAYCASGLYLKDSTGKIQLRVVQPDGKSELYKTDSNIGRTIEVMGYYPINTMRCDALMCSCDEYVVVDGIRIIQ